MTPKEKADSLIEKFKPFAHSHYFENTGEFDNVGELNNAKQCAFIVIDEVLQTAFWQRTTDYWGEVKKEIQKL